MSTLPIKNEFGFFEIRLESIGGLGANLAGKMLAQAGVIGHGLNGSNFSSYGSEKKGTPVKSFIRFCENDIEIRDHSPIERPHVIGVFHETLYKTVDVVNGLLPNGVVLVNTTRDFDDVLQTFNLTHGTIALIDAMGIAIDEKTKINTAMLGALFRICDFLDSHVMREIIRNTFEKKVPHLVEPNLRTFNRGYDEVRLLKLDQSKTTTVKPFVQRPPLYGYETQPIGGTIVNQGTSILKDLSGSRQGFIPALNLDTCIHCAACDTVCPDLCFVFEQGTDGRGKPNMFLKGIDYQYCKGCLKCVEACPTDALSVRREDGTFAKDHRIPHQFGLSSNDRGDAT